MLISLKITIFSIFFNITLFVKMISRNFHGLLEFSLFTLEKIHNAFHKGITTLEQDVECLAFDLHL